MHPIVEKIRESLKAVGEPAKAREMQRYMKTTQKFYGVQAAARKNIFRITAKAFPVTSRTDYEAVIFELWRGEFREDMYQALEVAIRFREFHDLKSFPIYEKLVYTSPNWDTLDWIAGRLVSPLVVENRQLESILKHWMIEDNFWVRRASLLAHLHHRSNTNTALLSKTILKLAPDKEFFVRKAIGWILRDYSYANPKWVKKFIEENQDVLSGLSKREALRHINRKKL